MLKHLTSEFNCKGCQIYELCIKSISMNCKDICKKIGIEHNESTSTIIDVTLEKLKERRF